MAWKKINIDLEANNLLAPMLDYSTMPYKLKDTARLWCISVRDEETEQSVLLLPEEVLDEQAPVAVIEYYTNEPEMELSLNQDGEEKLTPTGRIVKTLKATKYLDAHGQIMTTEYANGVSDEMLSGFVAEPSVLEDGIAYNNIPKRIMSYDMLKKICQNADEISGHNIISYDLPVLRLFGMLDYTIAYPSLGDEEVKVSTLFGKPITFTDTLIGSKLLNPDLQDTFGRHSIEAHGQRLGYPKLYFKEFDRWSWRMGFYGDNDTLVGVKLVKQQREDFKGWDGWALPYSQELKLMDLTVSQEHFGFDFDKPLAEWCLIDLEGKLVERANLVEPSLPPKPLNKGELNFYTPPAKQLLKNGKPNSFITKFAEKHGGEVIERPRRDDEGAVDYYFKYKDTEFPIPFQEPIETSLKTNIKDNDQVKKYLLDLGWDPTEWSERDLTKDSKKIVLSPEKAVATIHRYAKDTETSVYKDYRLQLFKVKTTEKLLTELLKQYDRNPNKPIKVRTSPKLRVGATKDLCPNLEKIDKDPEFVKAIAEWHTYTHRKNSISGGGLDDEGNPQKGFLSFLREDGRVATPADTMGAASFRYTHKNICNISRVSSLYGEYMRALFGSGEGLHQLGFDFASLEARVQAHYIYKYLGGPELGEALLAEKPNDIHTLNAKKLGISRDNAKSITYALLYGAAAPKLQKMLGLSPSEADQMYEDYWDAVPPLKKLRDDLVAYWERVDKDHIVGIDGRKLRARSPHSLINLLFQSAGAILAKWAIVRIAERLEKENLLGNPFIHAKDEVKVWQMIVYHDEAQYAVHKSLLPQISSFFHPEVQKEYEQQVDIWKENGKNPKEKPSNPFEKAAEDYIEQHTTDDPLEQFSDIGHTDEGIYYVTHPNIVSRTIIKAIDEVVQYHNLEVPLGIAWITGRNWKMCH